MYLEKNKEPYFVYKRQNKIITLSLKNIYLFFIIFSEPTLRGFSITI